MSKILITGSTGYLGTHLCRILDEEKIFITYRKTKPQFEKFEVIQIDLLDSEELTFIFKEIKPDYVIHLAGIVPSQAVNLDEKFVYQTNVEVTKQIASLSHTFNSFLIFTSTDLVYDEGENIRENHPLNPLNLYARTKLKAEKSIEHYGKYYLILRTALMYGFSISEHKSFFDFSFLQLMNGQEVKAFYDQFRNALFVEEAAKFIKQLTRIKLPDYDVMNFCGFEKLSRYEMVLKTAEVFGLNTELVKKESCESFTQYKMAKTLSLNFDKMKKLNLIPNSFLANLSLLKENFEFYRPYLLKEKTNES
jgi:dTDP-4-dehydrorhamnose reductase